MEKSAKLPEAFTTKMPWSKVKDSIWPATKFLLRRNLESHLFPSKLKKADALKVIALMEGHFSDYQKVHGAHLTPHQKELLFEHFILQEGFEKQSEESAYIVDETAQFLGLINLEDHLHLHSLTFDPHLTKTFKKLFSLEQKLSKELGFSYSPRFGYLTSDPSVCGTGLIVEAYLHLPALLQLEQFLDVSEKLPEGLATKGLGNEGEYLADLVLLQNSYTLGVSEEAILKSIEETAAVFKTAEETLRKNLTPEQTLRLKDKIGRSYGLISNACTLTAEEALTSLSLIQLGKDLGWITNADSFHFFDLFFSARRAHLAEALNLSSLSASELPAARKAHLKKAIAPLTLFND